MSYEKIIVVGNIGSVDELESKSGNKYLRMSVAVNRGTGEQKSVCWYSVLIFGKMAESREALMRVFTKGRQVLVEGRPQVEAFVKKDGSAGVDNTIIAAILPQLMDRAPAQPAA